MASATFEKTGWDWQLQQLSQRLGEWVEGLLSRSQSNLPTNLPVVPEWLLKALFWLLIVGATAWVGWQLYRLLNPYFVNYRHLAVPLVVALPQHSVAEWQQQAQAAQQRGNYREACLALYRATLQQLNDRGIILQEASRTDGEYLTLLQRQSLPQPYQILIQIHERLCFDQSPASSETYDSCWQAYQEIEHL